MGQTFAAILNGHLADRGWTFHRLATAAKLNRSTVHNWTQGKVVRVRHWQDVATAARALGLTRAQTDALLVAGGHPAMDVLLAGAKGEDDRTLLAHWTRTVPNNLPAQLTSFVGRTKEIEGITQLLTTARLVTLTGTGGSGKTRLAIEAAQSVLDQFEAVHFIDLAPISDPALVIPTVCRTLEVQTTGDEPTLDALKRHLRDRRVLLVLDNVEQVVAAAPLLTELLRAARDAKALVTSRWVLNVRGEHAFPLAPLAIPAVGADLRDLGDSPSVELFADRARAVDPAFTLDGGSAPLVAEVCRRLDGLPLAIELAATRTRHLRLNQMLETLTSGLALATDGPRDLPDRQRTLRATIAWSHDLLGEDERRLFDLIGVFVGGFTAESAEAVRAAIGPVALAVPAALAALVEQNLLGRTPGVEGAPRYAMLETIREYALERLEGNGEAETARRAAMDYFLALAQRADLEGAGQAEWLPRMVAEFDNVRAALEWCRARGQTETGVRLSVALMPLWQLRDHQREARSWLDAFMAAEDGMSPDLRARGLLWQGLLLLRGTGDNASAARLFAEALVLFRACQDLDGASETLQGEGDVLRNQQEWRLAAERYAESRELAEQAGNPYLVAHGWQGLALCAQDEGRFEDARQYWQLMLAWSERAGNEASVAMALNGLGEMARHREDWDQAEHAYERTLTLARALGNEFRTALALHNLAYVALARGSHERADVLFTESRSLYWGTQNHKGVAECLAGLGRAAALNGEPERAACLCGASDAILKRLGTRLDALDRADYSRTLETLRSRLGDGMEPLLDDGRAMSIADAMAFADGD